MVIGRMSVNPAAPSGNQYSQCRFWTICGGTERIETEGRNANGGADAVARPSRWRQDGGQESYRLATSWNREFARRGGGFVLDEDATLQRPISDSNCSLNGNSTLTREEPQVCRSC